MNAMQVFSAQPWVERLGWTLVHFLWQGLAIAALYAAARRDRAFVQPERTIPSGLRGARGDAGRSLRDLDRDAPVGRGAGGHPSRRPGSFRRSRHGHRLGGLAPIRPRGRFRRMARAVLAVGGRHLARRLDGVLGAPDGRMGSRRAPAVQAGSTRAARMAADPRQARRADRPLSARAVAGLRAGRGAGGRRLASSRGAGAGGSAGRFAGRTDGGAADSRAGAHPPARLPGEHPPERRRGAAVLPSRGVVGVGPHSRRARAVLRRCCRIGHGRRAHVCARPGGAGIVPPGPRGDGRERRLAGGPHRQAAGPVPAGNAIALRVGSHGERDSAGDHGLRAVRPAGCRAAI